MSFKPHIIYEVFSYFYNFRIRRGIFQYNFTRSLPEGVSKLRGTELNFKLTSKYRLLSLTCVSDSQWDVIFSEGTIIFYAIAFSRDISKIFDHNNKYDFWTN